MNEKIDLTTKQIDAWIGQYGQAKQEIAAHVGYYKSHVRNFQLLLGAVIGVAGVVAAHPALLPNNENWVAWCIGILGLQIVATYLFLDIMEPLYIVNITAEWMSAIEVNLNRLLASPIFVIETHLSPKLHGGARPMPGVVNPAAYLWSSGLLIYISVIWGPVLWLLWQVLENTLATWLLVVVAMTSNIIVGEVVWNFFKVRVSLRPLIDSALQIRATTDSKSEPLGAELGRRENEISPQHRSSPSDDIPSPS